MENKDYSKKTVLVVDDIAMNTLVVTKMLAVTHVKTLVASNGKKALELIEQNDVDLVLLDLMMPIMDGFQVLEIVRSDPQYDTLPIVVLSALNSDSDIATAKKKGANGFLTKPIIMADLLNTVSKYLDE